MKKVKIKVENTTTGYSAYVEKYAAYTTGKNIPELMNHMVDALNLYFEEAGIDRKVCLFKI